MTNENQNTGNESRPNKIILEQVANQIGTSLAIVGAITTLGGTVYSLMNSRHEKLTPENIQSAKEGLAWGMSGMTCMSAGIVYDTAKRIYKAYSQRKKSQKEELKGGNK